MKFSRILMCITAGAVGGRLWILGLKTEKDDNVIKTKNGGATEVLGGLLYPAGTVDSSKKSRSSTTAAHSA